jgi:hypothetical protein
VLFGNLGVNLRFSLSGVPTYASAQTHGFVNLARKPLVSGSETTLFQPETAFFGNHGTTSHLKSLPG